SSPGFPVKGRPFQCTTKIWTGNTATCWIPSVAGTQFSVHWRCVNPQDASSGHVFIDGNDVASAIIRPGAYNPVLRSGAKTKDGLRPFTFAKLNLTDNERLANPRDPTLMDIGSIELRLTYVRLGPPVKFEGYETKNRGLVHERAKKMGAHYTAYGKATELPKSRAVSTAPLDPGNPGPHVRFIFRYRSLEVLQAQGIVPLPQKKRPAEEEEEAATQGTLVSSDPDDGGEPGGSNVHDREGVPNLPRKKRPRRLSSGSPENDENMVVSTAASDDGMTAARKMPLFMEDDEDNEGQSIPALNSCQQKRGSWAESRCRFEGC
ncbi:hypothetical protein BS47DRAFT_1421412, partial [Hydnum rufescens UP504]